MTQCCFSFDVRSTGSGLELHVIIDDQRLATIKLTTQVHTFRHELPDDWQYHCIQLELAGKQSHHTQLDQDGNIIQDTVAEISNVHLDGIACDQTFNAHCVYHHDFNGHGSAVAADFFGTMGCNGTVTFRFQGPPARWLIQHT